MILTKTLPGCVSLWICMEEILITFLPKLNIKKSRTKSFTRCVNDYYARIIYTSNICSANSGKDVPMR